MQTQKMIKSGAYCLLIMSVLWIANIVFSNIFFGYPWVMDIHPHESLHRLLMRGSALRLWLQFFSFAPLLIIPGSVALYYAFRDHHEGQMRIANQFLFIAMITMILRLFIWPGLNWHMATFYVGVPEHRAPILAVLYSINYYVRVLIGEYLSLFCFSIWTFILSYVIYRDKDMPRWYAYVGYFAGLIIFLEVFFRAASWDIIPDRFLELVPFTAAWIFILSVGVITYKTK